MAAQAQMFPDVQGKTVVLTEHEIREFVSNGWLVSTTTFDESSLEATSYDVRVGSLALVPMRESFHWKRSSSPKMYLPSVFELRAGKRGGRLGWKESDGEMKSFAKNIAHSNEPGVICWREADPDEVPELAGPKKIFTKEDVMPHVPTDKAISKDALRSKVNGAGIALNKINGMMAELVQEGRLFEWRVARKGTNPQKLIARFAQPPEELIK